MSCDGSCCVAFPLSVSLDRAKVGSGVVGDGDLLGFMLRPLTHEQVLERRDRFGLTGEPVTDRQMYRCVYWDENTRLCGIYEQRPNMCRTYPNSGTCEHGCDCVGEDCPERTPFPPYLPAGAFK